MSLTEISTFGWFGSESDLVSISTFGWYTSGAVTVGFNVAYAGAGFIATSEFGVAGP